MTMVEKIDLRIWVKPYQRQPAWLIPLLIVSIGASDPEVKQVRAPAHTVVHWFPPGSELRILPFDEFEVLLKKLHDKPSETPGPILLNARHSVRWEPGLLIGQSEFEIRPPTVTGSTLIFLDPWSPFLLADQAGPKWFRTTEDGRLAIQTSPKGPTRIEAQWQLLAHPGSDGRAFVLALPQVDVSTLSLDLPDRYIPVMDTGPAIGPEPSTIDHQNLWRFGTARGRMKLQLRDAPGIEDRPVRPSLWLEGPTRIDLKSGQANWLAEWTLVESADSIREFAIDLDPRLELIEVTGPRVVSYRPEVIDSKNRLWVKLDGNGPGTSPLSIKAICRPPLNGDWAIPSARPFNAIWTGGRTSIKLDQSRILQACKEGSGRRLFSTLDKSIDSPELLFESIGGVDPIATLTFQESNPDASVEIQGLLRLGEGIPRIEVALTWIVERGRLLSRVVDLSPGWTTDRIIDTTGQPVEWHAERQSNGGTRVLINRGHSENDARSLTFILEAQALQAGVTGPLDLPRVRPTQGTRIRDEYWAAIFDRDIAIRPILGQGIAWIDPPGMPKDEIPTPWSKDQLQQALAWRWLADDAEAGIVRSRAREYPLVEVKTQASIVSRKINIVWKLTTDIWNGDLRSIPLHLNDSIKTPIRWRSKDATGHDIVVRPIEDHHRSEHGFPDTGSAFELILSGISRDRVELEGFLEMDWPGSGRIPLMMLPERFQTRGFVEVFVEENMKVKFSTEGLTTINRPEDSPANVEETRLSNAGSLQRMRQSGVFGYRLTGGHLKVETTQFSIASPGGLIRDATLISRIYPGAGSRQRLSLKLDIDTARSIELKMPRNIKPDRAQLDGQQVVPLVSDGSLLIELPVTTSGKSTSLLTLDYGTDDRLEDGPLQPSQLLPICSLPCLSFNWEIIAPKTWSIDDPSPGLIDSDLRTQRSLSSKLFGIDRLTDYFSGSQKLTSSEIVRSADLDRVDHDVAESSHDLGGFLLRMDAGRRHIVIDRLAMESAGQGPASRIKPEKLGSITPNPNKLNLESIGLQIVTLDDYLLVTSSYMVPEKVPDRNSWANRFREAIVHGADDSDRYQSVSRWIGESMPHDLPSGESIGRSVDTYGWQSHRFVSTGWPAIEASIRLRNVFVGEIRGWLLTLAIVTFGLFGRNLPLKTRALVITLFVGISISLLAWTWPEPPPILSGVLRGMLSIGAIWFGRSFRLRAIARSLDSNRNPPSENHKRSVAVAGISSLIAIWLGLVSSAHSNSEEPRSPIHAILPYQEPFDPSTKPDRVVMLLADYEYLQKLTNPIETARVAPATLQSARHEVHREKSDQASVESLFEVEVYVGGLVPWKFPVNSSYELSANIDEHHAPITISPDGQSGMVSLDGIGTHRIKFRRSVRVIDLEGTRGRLQLPINRAAFSEITVIGERDTDKINVSMASGRLEYADRRIKGGLGPNNLLEVIWLSEDRTTATKSQPSYDATVLWEARPQGDSLRMKLTSKKGEELSTIRIGLEAGLFVRDYEIPNLVATHLEGTIDRPIWVAQLDPPLPHGRPIEVNLWRSKPSDSMRRAWPRIEFPGSKNTQILIGCRKLSNWPGVIEPQVGIEAIDESVFWNVWGNFPGEGMDLFGVVRIEPSMTFQIATAPNSLRRTIRPKVEIALEAGQMDVKIDAILIDQKSHSFDLEMGLPNEFRIKKVEAAGLRTWYKISRDRICLQFDPTEEQKKIIHVDGFLPAYADSTMNEIRNYQSKIPWPRWFEAEELPGQLLISSGTAIHFEPGNGIVMDRAEDPLEIDASNPISFQVNNPADLSDIRWPSLPSRLGVSVLSDLTIDPAGLTWTAVVCYNITGGPADSLHWNLPTEWADEAKLEIEGVDHRLVSERKGSNGELTLWTIIPASPLWGRAKLILRGKLPFRAGEPFNYPALSPLASMNRGSVEQYDLAIANVSGLSMEVSGSSGLQPVDVRSFRNNKSYTPPASIDHAYHVSGDHWWLRVRVGRVGDRLMGQDSERTTKVSFAQLTCSIREDGGIFGQALYDLDPQTGPFLAVKLAEPAEIFWASLDGVVKPVLREGDGRWLVPLGDGPGKRLLVCWRQTGSDLRDDQTHHLGWPNLDQTNVSTLISIFSSVSTEIIANSSMDKCLPEEREIQLIEHLARRLIMKLSSFDRSSSKDHELIVDDLIELDLKIRDVRRIQNESTSNGQAISARLKAARDSVVVTIDNLGLDDLNRNAQSQIGFVNDPEDRESFRRNLSRDFLRIRQIGQVASYFQTSRNPSEIDWKWRRPVSNHSATWIISLSGFAFALGIGWLIASPSLLVKIGIGMVVILTLLVWQPILTGALVFFITFGYIKK